MDEKTRQQITWTIIIAVVVSLIVLGVQRRYEADYLTHVIATGSPQARVAAVRTLIEKQKLAEALEDRPRWTQMKAIQAATMIGSEQALFQLVAAKSVLDTPVVAVVDEYLASMGVTAIGPLVQAIQDKDGAVRGGAGGPLKAIGGPAVDSLMPLIDVYDDAVRGLVAGTLGGIGEPAVKPLMRIMKQTKPLPGQEPAAFRRAKSAAQAAFTAMGENAFGPITEQILTDPNAELRSIGCTILGTIADQTKIGAMKPEKAAPVVAPLVKLLNTDPDWTVRRRAATSLGLLLDVARANGATAPLIARLTAPGERPEVRAAAAKALGEMRAPEAAGPLAHVLMTNRTGATAELATALQRIGPPSIAPLIPALSHSDPQVRLVATQSIATIGTAAAVGPLGKALSDPDVKVRRAAADALRTLANATILPQLAQALADKDWQVYYAARDALAHVGAPAAPTLINALGHPDTRVRYMAEQALAAIGAPALPALVGALRSPNPAVVEWSAIALGDIGADAVDPAARVLADGTGPLPARVAAARALGLTKSRRATQPLVAAASAPSPEIRQAAVRALSEVGDADATETLANALLDQSPMVRETAMQVLRNWRVGDIDQRLAQLVQGSDTNAARRAAVVLAQHVSAAGGGLLAALMRTGAETGTGAVPTDQIRTQLEAAVRDANEAPGVRAAAIVALGYVGGPSSLDALAPLLRAGGQYAVAAAKAVGHIGQKMAEAQAEATAPTLSQAAQMLLDMFQSAQTDELRMVAATGLSLMGGQPVAKLVEMMQKQPDSLRPWIAAVLGAIGKPATDPVLDARGLASDPKLRSWYAATLKLIGDARALDLLEQLPAEEQPDPQHVAAGQEVMRRLLANL